MPFVFAQTEAEGPDEAPPSVDQFVYIPAPQFGGARDPVEFSVPPFTGFVEPIEPPQPALPQLAPPQPAPAEPQRQSLLGRLLGRRPPIRVTTTVSFSLQAGRQHSQQRHEERRAQLFAAMVPVLKEIGVRRVYCRYDGGNDEGFAWLESMEMRDGARIDGDARRDVQAQAVLHATDLVKRSGAVTDEAFLANLGCDWLCDEWATMLLGSSYGTGEYSMYGAFTIDLDDCTITDDTNADPVVQNITIAE
jgi:hypothetical protein